MSSRISQSHVVSSIAANLARLAAVKASLFSIARGREQLRTVLRPALMDFMSSRNRVLFLCTGNYYRSRYAEELFNHRAKIEGLAWRAFSRGVVEKGSPENVGPMSQFALEALQAKAIMPEGLARYPQPCRLADFDQAKLVIALKEAEHRPIVEQRFPEAARRVTYWHVDDIAFAHPSIALAMIDDRVDELISSLEPPPTRSLFAVKENSKGILRSWR